MIALPAHSAVLASLADLYLAGENIASGRWNAARKQAVLESRERSTRLLSGALASLRNPPKALVSASAIGFYGDRADAVLTEGSAAGDGFLADVCKAWEVATLPASEAGIRVVNLRIGVVLSRAGGALASMLPPFRAGVGGRLGSGAQYVSWISLDDVLGAIHHCLFETSLTGAVNAVAPAAATNAELTAALGRVLGRPTAIPVPATVVRAMLGEMADALLLASTRVVPQRLLETGCEFRDANLDTALRSTLGRLRS